jgi:hypothetical protein
MPYVLIFIFRETRSPFLLKSTAQAVHKEEKQAPKGREISTKRKAKANKKRENLMRDVRF